MIEKPFSIPAVKTIFETKFRPCMLKTNCMLMMVVCATEFTKARIKKHSVNLLRVIRRYHVLRVVDTDLVVTSSLNNILYNKCLNTKMCMSVRTGRPCLKKDNGEEGNNGKRRGRKGRKGI